MWIIDLKLASISQTLARTTLLQRHIQRQRAPRIHPEDVARRYISLGIDQEGFEARIVSQDVGRFMFNL